MEGRHRAALLTPNVAHMLWDTAAAFPDRPAMVGEGGAVDFGGLRAHASSLAEALRQRGVRPGDRVGILLEGRADAAAAFFGTVAIGGIAVPINEVLRPRQIEHILRDSGSRFLVTSAGMLSRQPRALESEAELLDVAVTIPAGSLEPVRRTGADPVQIIYTSGTTGLPKGVVLSHANVWAWTNTVADYLGLLPDDRIASLLPFSYVYGLSQLLCAVATGACLVIERSPLPQQILRTLTEESVTVLAAVPPLWLQLLKSPGLADRQLPALRVMTNAGGRIPVGAVRKLRLAQPQAQLFLMYGSTEALRSTFLDPAEVDRHPDSIGKAIPGAEILVLRDDLSPCEIDEIGELVQRGPTVALGYWNDAGTTARVFRPNPLRLAAVPDSERVVFTGDLVRRDADGFLFHMGRRDSVIKTLGYRLSPDEVVDALYASGHIVEAIVLVEPDDQRGHRIIAHVVLAEGATQQAVETFCRLELPRYMQPSAIVACPSIPRTSSGKHDVRAVYAAHVAV